MFGPFVWKRYVWHQKKIYFSHLAPSTSQSKNPERQNSELSRQYGSKISNKKSIPVNEITSPN